MLDSGDAVAGGALLAGDVGGTGVTDDLAEPLVLAVLAVLDVPLVEVAELSGVVEPVKALALFAVMALLGVVELIGAAAGSLVQAVSAQQSSAAMASADRRATYPVCLSGGGSDQELAALAAGLLELDDFELDDPPLELLLEPAEPDDELLPDELLPLVELEPAAAGALSEDLVSDLASDFSDLPSDFSALAAGSLLESAPALPRASLR